VKSIQSSLPNLGLIFSGFPQRLELRPMGPRDPPIHFQRKQEYL
jgi:hypothetical protein